MEHDKIKELLAAREAADQESDSVRTPVTVLFSDIKGSTAYFERYGDIRGLAMVQRHNSLLFPIIEGCGGRVVKTIGDAIMAVFDDPKGAVQGAIGMQRVLEGDRILQPASEQIHIKVGLHTGPCLVKDKDVYGDVVNVASRVQNQSEPDQILITEDLLGAAKMIGVQCAQMGQENMRGRIEPIEIYAVAWSATSNDQLIEELQSQFERRLKEAKRRQEAAEQEFETARDQWRAERRRFTAEIERVIDVGERAKEIARSEVSADLQAEIRHHLEEAVRARQLAEQDLELATTRWETERIQLKSQMETMQRSAIDVMEQANNPTRIALAVREKLEQRLAVAKQEWNSQWEGERLRMQAEIDQLKKAAGISPTSLQKEAAKRALREMLGKSPAQSSEPEQKTSAQWEEEFHAAKSQWELEQKQLLLKLNKSERELHQSIDDVRGEVLEQLRAQYEPQLATALSERQRLSHEVKTLMAQLAEERQRNSIRMDLIEKSVPAVKEAAKKQAVAEVRAEFDLQIEELNRMKARTDRRYQDESEEWETERRRIRKQVSKLEEELKEAKEAALRAQRIHGETQE